MSKKEKTPFEYVSIYDICIVGRMDIPKDTHVRVCQYIYNPITHQNTVELEIESTREHVTMSIEVFDNGFGWDLTRDEECP